MRAALTARASMRSVTASSSRVCAVRKPTRTPSMNSAADDESAQGVSGMMNSECLPALTLYLVISNS